MQVNLKQFTFELTVIVPEDFTVTGVAQRLDKTLDAMRSQLIERKELVHPNAFSTEFHFIGEKTLGESIL